MFPTILVIFIIVCAIKCWSWSVDYNRKVAAENAVIELARRA